MPMMAPMMPAMAGRWAGGRREAVMPLGEEPVPELLV